MTYQTIALQTDPRGVATLTRRMVDAMQAAGVQMNIHTNGDEASAVAIEAIARSARRHPWRDARHILQHAQMMGVDQFERCRDLGICVNIFSNHIWYYGDQHAALTIGNDRAEHGADDQAAGK